MELGDKAIAGRNARAPPQEGGIVVLSLIYFIGKYRDKGFNFGLIVYTCCKSLGSVSVYN